MKVKDLIAIINKKSTNIIYENYWTGERYNWVDENSEVGSICPIDSSTIKLGIFL